GRASFDVALAAGAAAELVRAQERWLGALELRDGIDDAIITLGRQYHVVRPLGAGREEFLYLVLSRERANLGLARRQLAKLARRLKA
ncbi:MAG: hypothetical protein ACREMJ_12900, partial [Gemmatimonadales bacterium]